MKPLSFDLEAVTEMETAAEWYEQRQRGLARRFLDEIERVQVSITERPAFFPRLDLPPSHLMIRRAFLYRFPYALVFLDREDEIRVLAVAHTKRRPSYWLNRLRYI